MRSTGMAIILFAKRTRFTFSYFEVRVRYRRKKVHFRYLIS